MGKWKQHENQPCYFQKYSTCKGFDWHARVLPHCLIAVGWKNRVRISQRLSELTLRRIVTYSDFDKRLLVCSFPLVNAGWLQPFQLRFCTTAFQKLSLKGARLRILTNTITLQHHAQNHMNNNSSWTVLSHWQRECSTHRILLELLLLEYSNSIIIML